MKTPDTSCITRSRSGTPASSRRTASASATTKTPKKRAHDQKKWTDPRNKQAAALLKALVDPAARNKGYQGVRMLYPDIGGHDDRAAEKVWAKKKKDPKYWEEAREILERNPSPDRAPPAPLGVVQHGTLSGLHLNAAAGAAGAAGNGFSALSISGGGGGGDGVNRQLVFGGGAATGGGGGRLKTTGLDDDGAGTGARGAGDGAGMMAQFHQHGGAAGTGARGAGGFTAAMTPYGHGAGGGGDGGHADDVVNANGGGPYHVIPIMLPEQKVEMERAKATRAVAEANAAKYDAEAAKDRKVIATALATLSVTVNQHTGQIGDLQEGQQGLQEGQDLHASQIGDLEDRVEKLEIQGQNTAQLTAESVQHQTELKNYVDVGQTQLKKEVEMRLGPLPPNGNN